MFAMTGLLLAQQPSREYVRLGGRVIAIENYGQPVPDVTLTTDVSNLSNGASAHLTANIAVSWTMTPTIGTLTPNTPPTTATYSAPGTIATQLTVTIRATSAADSSKNAEVRITLTPAAFGWTQPSMSIANAGGTQQAPVVAAAGTSWNVTTPDGWISGITPSTGSGNSTISFAVAANTGGTRTGSLVLHAPPLLDQTMRIVQSATPAASVSISVASASAPAPASPGSAVVVANGPWTASSNASWLITTSTGSGSTPGEPLAYSVAENTGSARSGVITVRAGTASASLTVTQAHGVLTLTPAGSIRVVSDAQVQFTAQINGHAATVTWSASGQAGLMASGGLFKAGMAGGGMLSGVVTATSLDGTLSSSTYVDVSDNTGAYMTLPPSGSNRVAQDTAMQLFIQFSGVQRPLTRDQKVAPAEILITANAGWPTYPPLLTNSCHVRWRSFGGAPYIALTDDDGVLSLWNPLSQGVTLANSQCEIDLSRSSVTWFDTDSMSSLNLDYRFKSGFIGTKNIWVSLTSLDGNYNPIPNIGWTQIGTWNVVAADSVSVSAGSGPAANFTAQVSNAAGAASLQTVELLVSTTVSGVSSCRLQYRPAEQRFYVRNDTDDAWLGPASGGSAGSIGNTQCTLTMASAAATASGSTLTLTLPVTFAMSFVGAKGVWLNATDVNGVSSGWQQKASFTVHPLAGACVDATVSPNEGAVHVPVLLWQNDVTGQRTVHYYGGTGGAVDLDWRWLDSVGAPGWNVVGMADFDGDGQPDLVVQNATTRQVAVVYAGRMNWAWLYSNNVPGWRVAAVADFNGDHAPDLVWQSDSTGQVTVHYYGGTGNTTEIGWNWLRQDNDTTATVVAAADFDGNGVPDLVWQVESTRQVVVHYYAGTGGATDQGYQYLNQNTNAGWRVAAAADFDRNGVPDLVWQSDATRQVTVHYYGGAGGTTNQGWNWLYAGQPIGWRVAASK